MIKIEIRFLFTKLIQFLGTMFFYQNLTQSRAYKNILLIRLDEIGDVVLMTPLLREMRSNYPEADITLIVKPQVYNLVELCPYVNKVMTFDRYEGRFSFIFNIIKAFRYAKVFLWKEKYDLVIVPRWDTDHYGASFLAFFSGGIERLAYSETVNVGKQLLNRGYDRFFTKVFHTSDIKHEVLRNLDWINFLGGKVKNYSLELWSNREDRKVCNSFGGESKNCFRIAVVTSAGAKRNEWDINNFIDLIQRIRSKKNVEIVLLGGGYNTYKLGEILKKSCKVEYDFIGKTTLRETVEILKTCSCFIGCDTGPMHLAAACGLSGVTFFVNKNSIVEQYGLDTAKRFGPWNSHIITFEPKLMSSGCENGCKKEFAHCINQITVDDVYEELKNILNI